MENFVSAQCSLESKCQNFYLTSRWLFAKATLKPTTKNYMENEGIS